MDLQLLDQLEEKVDVTITAVNELRLENSLLREERAELQNKIQLLTKELGGQADGRAESVQYKARCEELEARFAGLRGRIEKIVSKMKTLES
ncbi:MAG TPA: cell division protein ZapB [bacterium]|nr:cell division protein ZapB [bacterium]